MSRLMIVPAAGRGSRLGSTLPKALVPINGRPMLDHVLDCYRPVVDHFVLVVSPSAEPLIRRHCSKRAEKFDLAIQPEPTGMLDAIVAAAEIVAASDARSVWVTWCDQVAVRPETVSSLARLADGPAGPALAFPTLKRSDPYIHFRRDAAGRITHVLQRREGDSMPTEGESDIGLFVLSRRSYLEWLLEFGREAGRGTGTGERNFLPFIPWLAAREAVVTLSITDPLESIGVNTPDELAFVADQLRQRA